MKIIWNKVTRLSQIVAIVLFVGVFAVGLLVGRKVGINDALGPSVADSWFRCDGGKSIHAIFYESAVHIALSDGLERFLPQTISASGARYATRDEGLVFWNKGTTAFVTQGDANHPTYQNCVSAQ